MVKATTIIIIKFVATRAVIKAKDKTKDKAEVRATIIMMSSIRSMGLQPVQWSSIMSLTLLMIRQAALILKKDGNDTLHVSIAP